MKMRIFPIGVFAIGLLFALPAQAYWTVAAQTAKSSFLVPIDAMRGTGPATQKKIQVLTVRKNAPKIEPAAEEVGWEFNCVTRQFRLVTSMRFDYRAGFIADTFTPTEWAPLNDGVAGYLSGFACGDTKPIGPDYPNLKSAIGGLWTAQ